MTIRPGAFLRTTLPLDLSRLPDLDSGRYHSVWLPDHMVSFWPDSIWNTDFTDLAITTPSPHKYLDSLTFAAAVAAQTENVKIATCVVDTVRRHPVMLAQAAITIDHFAKGRFIFGVGSGEMENCTPYGFDTEKPVSRFEEAIQVMRLMFESDGRVNFGGNFYQLDNARFEIKGHDGKGPPIWVGCSGPRMLGITGRHADGWWPVGNYTVEDFAQQLAIVGEAAERAGRDPMAIATGAIIVCLIGETREELEIIARQPLVRSFVLQMRADFVAKFGYRHPLGEDWQGFHDLHTRPLTRKVVTETLENITPQMVLDCIPNGTPKEMASLMKGYIDAGLQVPNFLDYGGMAGREYSARSAQNVRAAEDELMLLLAS